MATLTPVTRSEPNFYVPVVAAFGAIAGLFVGTAQGSGLVGIVIGAALLAILAFGAPQVGNEKLTRWIIFAGFVAAGFALGGIAGMVVGAIFGWFFGWLIFWLFESRYREHLAPYLTPGQVLWHYTFRVICGLIFTFLITPIIVVLSLIHI